MWDATEYAECSGILWGGEVTPNSHLAPYSFVSHRPSPRERKLPIACVHALHKLYCWLHSLLQQSARAETCPSRLFGPHMGPCLSLLAVLSEVAADGGVLYCAGRRQISNSKSRQQQQQQQRAAWPAPQRKEGQREKTLTPQLFASDGIEHMHGLNTPAGKIEVLDRAGRAGRVAEFDSVL